MIAPLSLQYNGVEWSYKDSDSGIFNYLLAFFWKTVQLVVKLCCIIVFIHVIIMLSAGANASFLQRPMKKVLILIR
jgi:hypothetical protein